MYKHVIKRLFDIVLGIIALPFVVLEFIFVAPLIYREDKGSVFYNAPRVGRNHKPFIMYKYRSMYMNAPDLKMSDGSTYNGTDDPRQTKIGAFLRKTSLDELPQVFNVLKGDMSFIGPRPDLAEEAALYEGDEGRKLEVRPGLSGYAQVYGRNAIAWHDRLALDVHYVDNQSFLLDLKIFFKTFAVVFAQEGVYVEGAEDAKGAASAQGVECAEDYCRIESIESIENAWHVEGAEFGEKVRADKSVAKSADKGNNEGSNKEGAN